MSDDLISFLVLVIAYWAVREVAYWRRQKRPQ
jgi:hypothetical protein